MQCWDYKVLVRWMYHTGKLEWNDAELRGKSSEQVLSDAGSEGWELVSVVNLGESSEEPGTHSVLHYVMKRPK